MKNKMKQYPQKFEPISDPKRIERYVQRMDTTLGSFDEYTNLCRSFHKSAQHSIFDITVKSTWLELQFSYDGVRRTRRYGNGFAVDGAYSHFLKAVVGSTNRFVKDNTYIQPITSYFRDFFPEFLSHDPFTEPEYFKYPYEYVSLDHLSFVYQVDERMEMLAYAEEQQMSFFDFLDWAVNHVFCYNLDVDETVYTLTHRDKLWPYVFNQKLDQRRLPQTWMEFAIPHAGNKNAPDSTKGPKSGLVRMPDEFFSGRRKDIPL